MTKIHDINGLFQNTMRKQNRNQYQQQNQQQHAQRDSLLVQQDSGSQHLKQTCA